MKKIFLKFLIALLLAPTVSASILLEKAPIRPYDKKSIERGAKFFATNCMVCHSLKYLKDDPLAKAAGIDYEKMPVQSQQWWEGKTPPDLSFVAQARGADWLYTYLHSFYQDNLRPSGNNNLLVENSNMPNPFTGLQGIQVLDVDKRLLSSQSKTKLRWFEAVKLVKQGSMTPDEFDKSIADTVNFLVYASDPFKRQREFLGWWVLGYLLIFGIVVYLLKQVYWKKIK